MYQTIQLSSCISVQGKIVEMFGNGDVVIRNGRYLYRGRPVAAQHAATEVPEATAAPATAQGTPTG